MTELHYTPGLIARFLEKLAEIEQVERDFQDKKSLALSEVVDRFIPPCSVCGRLMIPRRLWYCIEEHERPRWLSAVGDSQRKLCLSHKQPNRYRPKTAEIISKLQEQVGFDPARDYEAEDEASA